MFIYRTTTMPTLAKLTELERIVAIDGAGPNQPVSGGTVRAVVVGECLQGPFVPTVVNAPSDITNYFVGNPDNFDIISQSGFDPTTAVQDGSGVAFDGNLSAELKGKTFSGLVIQRVDCDMVQGDSSTTKAYMAFTVTVASADQVATGGTYGSTNKEIVIPSGTRFGNAALGSAAEIVALSQQITIPAGTPLTAANVIACAISFTQDPASAQLTYVTSGATTGATAFYVKGTAAASAVITTAIDTTIPGVQSTISASGVSTIGLAGTGVAAHAPAGGGAAPSPDTLANRITLNYAAAITKTLPGVLATNDIVAIWSARNYQTNGLTPDGAKTMRLNLWNNAIQSSTVGRGRVACVTSAPATSSTSTEQTTVKGVYEGLVANDVITGADADRYWLSGPYVQVFSTELNADIVISVCGSRACMKVNLANNGQSEYQTSVGSPENASIQAVDAQEPCFAANPMQDADFVAMKAAGVAWFVQDRVAGWWFYSGVTAANPITYENRVSDNRRSFADEIQDMIFGLGTPYAKKPGTPQRADSYMQDITTYVDNLVNPPVGDSRAMAAQVLDGAAAGNSQDLNSHGVYLFEADVTMYGDMNAIVIKTMIGPNVIISQATSTAGT